MKINKRKFYYEIENNKIDYSLVVENLKNSKATLKEASELLILKYSGDWYLFGLILDEWYGYKINPVKAKQLLNTPQNTKFLIFNNFHNEKTKEFEGLKHTFRG